MDLDADTDVDRPLLAEMKQLGLSDPKIHALAHEVESQLSRTRPHHDGADVADILHTLDARTFVRQVDVDKIADHLGIPHDTAQDAVAALALEIANFRR